MRKKFAQTSILLASVLLGLATAEMVARRVLFDSWSLQKASVSDAFYFREDPLVGWAHVPGIEGYFSNPKEGYNGYVTINELGMRNNSNNFEDELRNSPSILVIGDSFTAGFEVDDNLTYTAQLEKLLFKNGCRYRVHNAGVRGYGTDQSYWNLLILSEILKPEITIYNFTYNDLGDNRTFKRAHKRFAKSAYVLDGGYLKLVKPRSSYSQASYYSYINHTAIGPEIVEGSTSRLIVDTGLFLKENIALHHLLIPFYHRFFDPTVLRRKDNKSNLKTDLRVFEELLNRMKSSSGTFFVTESPTQPPDAPPYSRISDLVDFEEMGVNYLNLYPYFSSPSARKYRWKSDMHWSELGHKTAAFALFNELKDVICDQEE